MIYAVNKRTKEHQVTTGAVRYDERKWDIVHATPDGWIEWHGGECPLPDGVEYEIKRRDCEVVASAFLMSPSWSRGYGDIGSEIIAYRPILDADTKPEPPAWDGDGLPPVGCEVEVLRFGGTRWGRVVVRACSPDAGFLWVVDSGAEGDAGKILSPRLDRVKFRPIRSEEDQFVDEMVRDLADAGCEGFTLKHYARILYKAGYRK